MMNFYSKEFLKSHIESILDFYAPHVIDTSGGYFQNFKDNGAVFNGDERHLVSSCRMVFIFCKAYELFGLEIYRERAVHGLQYLNDKHWDGARSGYNWTLNGNHAPDDQTNHCYGLAFVILAHSAAYSIGIKESKDEIERVYLLMEEKLWNPSLGLYFDEASADWSTLSNYVGQNANMHACEAMLAAFDATGSNHYLQRSYQLAYKVTVELADKSDGLIWEHYTKDLDIDWNFNKHDPKNLYRPWGFQPGHQTEWTKLLLTLHSHKPEEWMPVRAKNLFDRALDKSWDNEYGGILYGFSPDGSICDSDKYFWVQAESIAAAARLYKHTNESKYIDWYQRIWEYSWQSMVDHKYGAWFRVLNQKNKKYSDEKSVAGGKCDYHTIGAFYDVLQLCDTD